MNFSNFILDRPVLSLSKGAVQDSGVPSTMGAPLILTKNRNNSPEISNPVAVEEQKIQTEISEHEEEKTVNGKLDINIKDNSIYEMSENASSQTQQQQLIDFKHNYH